MVRKINYKLIFSLLSLILILSVSSASAEILSDENPLNLMDSNEISISDGNIENLEEDNTNADNGLAISAANENSNALADSVDGEDDEDDDTPEDIAKNTSLSIISPDNWKIYDENDYKVKLVDEDSNPMANAKINFKIINPNGKSSSKNILTDEEGIAVLPLSFKVKGLYNIQVSYLGNYDFNPAESVSSNVSLFEKTRITTSFYGYQSTNLAIKLSSIKGDPLAKQKIVVYVDDDRYVRTTDENGKIYIKMPSDKKIINLNCTFSANDFYEKSNRTMDLPVYKKTNLTPLRYFVLKGQSFILLLKGIDGKILKGEKVKITINGKTYVRTTNTKGKAYFKVRINREVYQTTLAYGNNSIYGPSKKTFYLEVIDPSGQFKKALNQNTKCSVSKYLYGGGHARITKAIRKLAKKITKKYATKLEKATAIFNYLRNNLDYDNYANSLRGAAKTLRLKAGNCCDHANLIVALCRAVKIPARYGHAQGCRFIRSGSIEGHVWAQIYVNKRWYSADGTSYRNSLGHIKNWDTKHYYSVHTYMNIPF